MTRTILACGTATLVAACADAPVSPDARAVSLAPGAKSVVSELAQYATMPTGGYTTTALTSKNLAFPEGAAVAFRGTMTGLVTAAGNSHTVTISYDFTSGGHKAYDFLYQNLATNLSSATSFPIPADPFESNGRSVAGAMPGVAYFKMTNGTITSVSAYTRSGDPAGDSQVSITILFTANEPTVTLWWGGHLAMSDYWDATGPNGALTVGNGNWKMRLGALDGSKQWKSATIFGSAVVPGL